VRGDEATAAADVVDRPPRRRRDPRTVDFVDQGGDERAVGADDPRAAQLATFAIGDDARGADRDHHCIARPDLHERLRLSAWVE
jgi:hypothetical protein